MVLIVAWLTALLYYCDMPFRKTRLLHAQYLNGLERSKVGAPELAIKSWLLTNGIHSTHGQVPWQDPTMSFKQIHQREIDHVKYALRKYGRYILIGVSAGAGLALNTYQAVRQADPDADLYAVLISGWLEVGDIEELKRTALERPKSGPSQSFVDSVIRCTEVVAPSLTQNDTGRVKIIAPNDDDVVPTPYMAAEGLEIVRVGGDTHMSGIVHGLAKTPQIVRELLSCQDSVA